MVIASGLVVVLASGVVRCSSVIGTGLTQLSLRGRRRHVIATMNLALCSRCSAELGHTQHERQILRIGRMEDIIVSSKSKSLYTSNETFWKVGAGFVLRNRDRGREGVSCVSSQIACRSAAVPLEAAVAAFQRIVWMNWKSRV